MKFPVMCAAGLALLVVTACGGRSAKPVAEIRDTDAQLSCEHISAEAEVNAARILDLLGEEKAADENNAALLLAAPLSIAFPLFLDLGDAEQQEIRALEARTKRLATLGDERGCPLEATSTG